MAAYRNIGDEPTDIGDMYQLSYSGIDAIDHGDSHALGVLADLEGKVPEWLRVHREMEHSFPSPSGIMRCRLQQWFDAKKMKPDQSSPRGWKVRRAMGIISESYWLAVLGSGGADLAMSNKKFDCGPHMWAHPDAIMNGEFLVEIKSVCVSPGTRILTKDLRWRLAGELKKGDQVVSFDEETPPNGDVKWRTGTVTFAEIKKLPAYKVYLSNGEIITTTGEHGWKVPGSKWLTTKQLNRYPSQPSTVLRFLYPWDEDRSYEAGFLAAAFDGEGHIEMRHGGLFFDQTENELLDTVKQFLTKKKFPFSTTTKVRPDALGTKPGIEINILGGAKERWRFLGQIRPPRLFNRFQGVDGLACRAQETVRVEQVLCIGEQPMVALSVDKQTYLAEGYGAHNSGWGYRKMLESWGGVEMVEKGHYVQAQLYMYATGMPWTLYLTWPADFGQTQSSMRQKKKYGKHYEMQPLYLEWIPRNDDTIEMALERAEMVAADKLSNKPPPREFAGVEYRTDGRRAWPCGYCLHLGKCNDLIRQEVEGDSSGEIKFV